MNRKSLFGRFAAPLSARRKPQRPEHRRAKLEPLEDRKLLAIINVDDNWRLVASPIGVTVTLTFGADVISDQNSSPNNNKTGSYGITAFGTVKNGTSELTGANFLTVADDIDGVDNDTRFIQDAINKAANDDTVNILPGKYTESDIVVTKPLRLRGSGTAGNVDTVIVPEIVSAHTNEEFADNSHSGIIIYAPSVTVSLLRLDGNGNTSLAGTQNYHQGVTTLYDQQKNPSGYHNYDLTRGRGQIAPKRLGTYVDNNVEGTNPNRSRPRLVIKDVKVDNVWYHGITLSAMSGQHFNVGGSDDETNQNQVYNVVVNNVGPAGSRTANNIGVLLQNLQNHPDAGLTPTANTNVSDATTGITVSNVGIGLVARTFAGFFGSETYDSDAGARLDITIWAVTISGAEVEGIRLKNNSGGDGVVSNTMTFSPGNSAIGVHYIHSEALPLANVTISGAKVGIMIEDSDTQTKLTTPGGNTNPNGRNAVPIFSVGLKVIGPGITIPGSVGILADNNGPNGGTNTDAGFILSLECEITGFETGVRVAQSAPSNRSTFVAFDRPNVHGNATGFNIGTGVIIQGTFNTADPFSDLSLLSPAYYPNLIENYADQLDDQPVPPTQPIAANVEPPPPIVSIESRPRPVTMKTGNLTYGAGTNYNPILNGTAGTQTIILEDFNVARTLTFDDVVSEDQINPWQFDVIDDDPNQPIYYKTPGVLGLWFPDQIPQDGNGTVVLEATGPLGALFDAQSTAPIDASSMTNLRIVARRGPNQANGVKQIAIGVVDQDGTADIFFIPTSALETQYGINSTTFVTFDVNLLTPPIRFTEGDGILNLSAITGWAAAGDLAFTDFKIANPISIEIDSLGFSKGPASSVMDVTGSVTLGAGVATLDPVSGGQYVSSNGQKFVIINNDGADAVSGTFKDSSGNNLTEGALFTAHGRHYSISYKGLDASTGNDVVLTQVATNVAPVLDLDSGAGGTGFSASWAQGNSAVAITAPTGATVTDADDLFLDKMTATLTTATPHLQQVITLASAAAGNFMLTYDGKSTTMIPYNASAATVQAALEALSTIGSGNVTVTEAPDAQHVTGSQGGPYTVTFGGAMNLNTLKKIKGDISQLPRRLVTLRNVTGGTMTFSYRGQTTAAFNWDQDAATVQTRLQALSTIGSGNVTVTGAAGGPWNVTFGGTMDLTNLDTLVPNIAGLSGIGKKVDSADVDRMAGAIVKTNNNIAVGAATIQVLDGGIHPGDRLNATGVGAIVVEYNATSGQLKMSGTDTKANYQTVLRSITYNSVSHPVAGTRTVKIVANDGADNSNETTATITITANALPVLDLDGAGGTNNFTAARTHNALYQTIVDTDATVTDSDTANVSSATARVTAVNPHVSQLIKLVGTNNSNPTGGLFSIRYKGQVSGEIAWNATAATVETTLEAMSSIGANLTVTGNAGGPWTVVFTSGSTTNLAKFTGNFFNSDGTNQLLGGTAPIVSIIDSPPHMTQTVTLTGAPTGGNFKLTFLGQTTANIAFNASNTTVQTAIRNLPNVGSANVFVAGPNGGPWVVTFGGPSSTIDLSTLGNLTPDSSLLTGGVSPAAVVTQAEAGVEVYPGDLLSATMSGGVSQSYDGNTGILTMTGSASKATYETILRTLSYNSSAISPPAGSRLVKIALKDNVGAETVDPYSTINIAANELPWADLNGVVATGRGYTATWSRATTAVNIMDGGLGTLTDDDDTQLVGMTARLTTVHSGDVLAATGVGNITVTAFNATTGVLSMSGVDSVANYLTVLQTITYDNTNALLGPIPPVASKQVEIVADDGNGGGISSVNKSIATVTITPNAKPVVDLDASASNDHTVEWVTPTTIAITDTSTANVSDGDDTNLVSVVATLVSPEAGDVLNATASGGISVSYNSTTGVLRLTGNAAVGNYTTVLRTITYNNTLGVPSAAKKTVNIVATDPLGTNSDAHSSFVVIDKLPLADLDGGAPTTWSSTWNNTGAVNITDSSGAAGAAVIDVDDGKVGSMTATLQGTLHTGDVLTAVPQAGITVSYSSTTGILSMTGVASKILYKAVLQSIKYNNTVAVPPVASKTVNIRAIDPSGAIGNNTVATVNIAGGVPTTIVARKLFYNNSAFDGNSAAINFTNDNNAVATDKSAYLPNDTTAVFNNVSSFTIGITGIIIDLSTSGGSHGAITASDFIFKVGNNNSPGTWATATAPTAVSVSLGFGGNDRVEITWGSNVIKNQWLEVQVKANANTGLAAADVFFWGNKAGDVGPAPSATDFPTTVAGDGGDIVTHLGAGGGVTNIYDINRSNSVTVSGDRGDVISNLGTITRIKIPAAGPFAPGGGDGDGDAGISSALAGGSGGSSAGGSSSQALPTAVEERLASGGGSSGSAAIDAALASSAADDDDASDDGDELDELLDSLAAGA